ncbi:hypothetical protein [Flavobacterium sp. 3HN19-14]|uniref:hypothetical protein n=1 Tax=Flavobacterium sp. 3HN19-14 TaxID=3448133 RepID=UPI003EE0B3F2
MHVIINAFGTGVNWPIGVVLLGTKMLDPFASKIVAFEFIVTLSFGATPNSV